MKDYAAKLLLSNNIRESLVRLIIKSLNLPEGSLGLDVGCGIGSHTLLLAEAIGKTGNVVGIDLSENQIEFAQTRTESKNFVKQVVFKKGDMNSFQSTEDPFDWAWSMDCVGYAPGNLIDILKSISNSIKPGGNIYILAWSSQQLLPGYPQLEARFNATNAGISPFKNGSSPTNHFLSSLHSFKAAGLENCCAQTFVKDIQAPIDDIEQEALISLFEMRWGTAKSELSESDYIEFKRLCDSKSPDCVLKRPDYYGFFTYTMFRGTVT